MVQAEVVLAAEQRVGALVLEGDLEHLAAEGERVRRLHTLPRGGGKEGEGSVLMVIRSQILREMGGWGGGGRLLTPTRRRRAWYR